MDRGHVKLWCCAFTATVVAFALAPLAAQADPPLLGVIPLPGAAAIRSNATAPLPPLTWHGGPVVRTHTVYTLYWVPPGYSLPPSYQSGIDGFFGNAQAALASGAHDNVYGVAEQYCGTNGSDTTCDPAGPAPAFGGALVDPTPYPPASGDCLNAPGPCITDVQIQSEVESVAGSQGWQGGLGTIIVVLTPANVDECTHTHLCTFPISTGGFCGYHTYTTDANHYLYVVAPDSGAIRCAPASLAPRGDVADTLDVVSHEHIEAITDPLTTGWWAGSATTGEIADVCRRSYGPAIAGAGGANQIINGTGYLLQQEQSNVAGACIQGGFHQLAPHFTYTGRPAAGSPVTEALSTGSSPYASIVNYRWDLGDGSMSQDAQPQRTYASPGTYHVTVTITDADGDIGTATESLAIGRASAGLRIASLSTPRGKGSCRVSGRHSSGSCTAARLKVKGAVGDSAASGRITLTLRGTVGGRHVTVHKHASVFSGAFSAAIAFPRSQHHSGERWTLTVSYAGDSHLLPGTLKKTFRLEAG
jgi:hypothetical protein